MKAYQRLKKRPVADNLNGWIQLLSDLSIDDLLYMACSGVFKGDPTVVTAISITLERKAPTPGRFNYN